ncbi:MAG: acetyl esterase [Candidatus Eremiobacteraeota bacterium]|jgi:acetyl esterase|nr:acetyl esterase [Candidatus Eremiobacteraeota bacterium]
MPTQQLAEGIDEYLRIYRSSFTNDFYRFSIPEQRERYRNAILKLPGCTRARAVRTEQAAVRSGDRRIPLRIYRVSEEPGQPCMIVAHGGGYALGDLDSTEAFAGDIAATAGVTTVAVDFRLAPEHVFPAGLEDLYDVLLDLVERAEHYRIDPARIGITGDSSGGGFSAALPLYARDRGGPRLAAQFPLNGVFDMHRWIGVPHDDPEDHFVGEMVFFSRTYLGPNVERDRQYASPLLADSLAGLPPAYIMSPEHDLLRIDSERYAARLRAEGVEAQLAVEPGMVHGCMRARGVSRPAYEAFGRLCSAISALLAPRA